MTYSRRVVAPNRGAWSPARAIAYAAFLSVLALLGAEFMAFGNAGFFEPVAVKWRSLRPYSRNQEEYQAITQAPYVTGELAVHLRAGTLRSWGEKYALVAQAWPYFRVFVKELDRLQAQYFLYGGSLLGMLRIGEQLVYDGDFDIFLLPWSFLTVLRSTANASHETNIPCPDVAATVVYQRNLTVKGRSMQFSIVGTEFNFFHVYVYDPHLGGAVKVTDIFTCTEDGWAKPSFLAPDMPLQRKPLKMPEFNLQSLGPFDPIIVSTLVPDEKVAGYLKEAYGVNYTRYLAPIAENASTQRHLDIESAFGSYSAFVEAMRASPEFREGAVAQAQKAWETMDCANGIGRLKDLIPSYSIDVQTDFGRATCRLIYDPAALNQPKYDYESFDDREYRGEGDDDDDLDASNFTDFDE
eukprot:CAMPEP_0117504000 /NCGR_PEP_ID=MMETSP0784-20121206/24621_1 /TAXON_ID=39447 /ORGANISM="" /LENGTH=410 /DNA_ID=CAMNT_0005299337 /DNA_START=88 /DNA_END=1320 /DNA_ORIENTATION=-